MAEDKPVAMFINRDGEKVQVGWASHVINGGRSFDLLNGFQDVKLKDVTFSDEEADENLFTPPPVVEEPLPQELADAISEPTPVEQAPDASQDAPRVDAAPDEEQAAEPVEAIGELDDDTVELSSGGEIVDIADEDEEAEFQRLLEEEQAAAEASNEDEDGDDDGDH